jgi:metal-responsive CopG/Arc/MetJ family transcriptional regulator
MPKIKIGKELYEKVKETAQKDGYSSLEEFVTHVLERELDRLNVDDSQEEVLDQLKGLGYIS